MQVRGLIDLGLSRLWLMVYVDTFTEKGKEKMIP